MTDNPYESPQTISPLVADDLPPQQIRSKTDRIIRSLFNLAALAGFGALLFGVAIIIFSERQLKWLSIGFIASVLLAMAFIAGILITAPIVFFKRVWESRRNSD